MQFDADVVLVSVGRRPRTEGMNLEAIGVELDKVAAPAYLLSLLRAFPSRPLPLSSMLSAWVSSSVRHPLLP